MAAGAEPGEQLSTGGPLLGLIEQTAWGPALGIGVALLSAGAKEQNEEYRKYSS